jgi:hypothetical protein
MEISMATSKSREQAEVPKLSDTALVILNGAVQREDRLVLPIPNSVSSPHNKVNRVMKDLISRGLIEESPAKLGDAIWRTDEQQRHLTLRISAAGEAALDSGHNGDASRAVNPDENASSPRAKRPSRGKVNDAKPPSKIRKNSRNRLAKVRSTKAKPPRHQTATKAQAVLTLLRRSQGATIPQMMKVPGWQAHSVRGFLSATVKSQMGLTLASERPDGKDRRYRIG